MAIGDQFLLTLRGHAATSLTQVQNTFVYKGIFGVCTSADLNDAFATVIVPDIANVTNQQYVMDDLYTINLMNPDDYNTLTVATPGTESGEFLPIFTTWAFEYVRTTRAIQNGRKAIGILSEAAVVSGNAGSGELPGLATLAADLLLQLVGGTPASTFAPQLWRRPGTYHAGVVLAPGQFSDVGNVVYKGVSTQNTRKIGRGA